MTAPIPPAAQAAAEHVRRRAEYLRWEIVGWAGGLSSGAGKRRTRHDLYDAVHRLRGMIVLTSDLGDELSGPRVNRLTGTSWSGLHALAQELSKDSPDPARVYTLAHTAIPK